MPHFSLIYNLICLFCVHTCRPLVSENEIPYPSYRIEDDLVIAECAKFKSNVPYIVLRRTDRGPNVRFISVIWRERIKWVRRDIQ